MAVEDRLRDWLNRLNDELDARRKVIEVLDRYKAGYPEPPEHVRAIKREAEYRILMRQAVTNWPELIVESVVERLEVTGFRFGDAAADTDVWEIWQRNRLDEQSPAVHDASLTDARAFAIVWTDPENTDRAQIVAEHASTTVVAYDPRTGMRAAALRRWEEGDKLLCTLYLRDGIYKFQSKGSTTASPVEWEERRVATEDWPLPNPLRVVPVVEFPVNTALGGFLPSSTQMGDPRKSKPAFGVAYGEFERVLPVIDRINTTIFNALLAQTYTSFPLRALIGDPIRWQDKTDANGNVITDSDGNAVQEAAEPFKAAINRLIQIENPDGKLVQLPESDLSNFTKFAEAHIRHLAAITKTPAHYLLGEMVNLSADAIRAAEAGLVSKIHKHHRTLGEAWEETMRLALLVENPEDPRAQVTNAEVIWKDPESRSLAERADAATKLASIGMPWQIIASKVLGMTPTEISQAEAQRGSDILGGLLTNPNGNGAPEPTVP